LILVALLTLLAGGLAGGGVWYLLRTRSAEIGQDALEGLQVFGALPEFTLTERNRQPVTRADMIGKVWVANFIYTRCADTCPLQTARLATLQADFSEGRGLVLISITVDPKHDIPSVLAEYAARFGADRERWWFLTGHKDTIYALIRDGFHLSVEDPSDAAAPRTGVPASRPKAGAGMAESVVRAALELFGDASAYAHSGSDFLEPPFLHSSWFVLGDRLARIRGYYRTEDEPTLKRLRRDIRILLSER
jgi:cytochrome oxidase Cu insertion factor (SCO1/SenC/PrrC family)